jgi:hypothetical protein
LDNAQIADLRTQLAAYIRSEVDKQVKRLLDEREDGIEYLSLPEVEKRTGVSICALKSRNRRGTIKLNRYGTNTLLMSWDEYQKLLKDIKKQR